MGALKLFHEEAIDRKARLREQELIIAKYLDAWRECGRALDVVRVEKLHHPEFATFPDYVLHRWGISKSEAYRRINEAKAADEAEATSPSVAKPVTRSAAEALASYTDPELRKRVWERAVREVENPTGADIEHFASLELLEDAKKVKPKDKKAIVKQKAKRRDEAEKKREARARERSLLSKAQRRAADDAEMMEQFAADLAALHALGDKIKRRVGQAANCLEEIAAFPRRKAWEGVAARQRALANEVRVLLAGRG